MANSNFIIHNGLQVGPYTVFAGNGDIITSGNISTTGEGSIASSNGFGGLNPASIYNGSSNVTVDTNNVFANVAGTNIVDVSSTGLKIAATTESNDIQWDSGALQVAGGAGISGNLFVGGNLNVVGNTTQINNTINNSVTGNLLIGPGLSFAALYANIQYSGDQDNYLQMQMQNLSTGTVASTDYVATADNGSDTDTFLDLGINGSGYVPSGEFSYSWPNDGYLYVHGNTTTGGGNLMLATMESSNTIFLAVGGQSSANIVANVASTGVLPGANISYNLGSSTRWWNNIYGTATHALYADLAENYLADRTYHAGTVLMFGGSAEVTMADADTKRVAGVVSTNPAHLMNGALQGAYVTPLALMGRVPCQVVGPIAKGDLLVAAGWGYAKTNNDAVAGQIIGKALEDFPQQVKGVIEVVVGRV